MAKRSPWADEAAMQSLVRYGPEISALTTLMSDSSKRYQTAVKQARGAADFAVATANHARPELAAIYENGGLSQARAAHSLVSQDLAKLGPGADYLKGAGATEQGAIINRLAGSESDALAELTSRKVQAGAGRQFAIQQAQSTRADEADKIGERLKSLGAEQGAFQATEIARLARESRDRGLRRSIAQAGNSQSERNSVRSSGIDPDTGKPIPGGKLDPAAKGPKRGTVSGTGVKLLSGEKHLATQDDIAKAVAALKRIDPNREHRSDAAPLLVDGHDSQDLYDPKTGKKRISSSGTPVKTPEVPGVGGLAAGVAADIYYDKHVSRKNTRHLQNAGFSLRKLGVPTYNDWRKQQRGQRAPSAGQVQSVRGALGLGQ